MKVYQELSNNVDCKITFDLVNFKGRKHGNMVKIDTHMKN